MTMSYQVPGLGFDVWRLVNIFTWNANIYSSLCYNHHELRESSIVISPVARSTTENLTTMQIWIDLLVRFYKRRL